MKTSIHTEVIVNIIRTAAVSILSFLTFPYITRVLVEVNGFPPLNDVNGLGLYSWATALLYFFMVLARIGIPNIAIRECSKVKNDKNKLSLVAKEFFVIQAITTILSFGALLALIYSSNGVIFDNRSILFILSLNFLTSVFSFEWVFVALRKHFYIALRSIIVLSFTSILIFIMVKKPEDILLYSFLTILGSILTVIINLAYLRKLINLKHTGKLELGKYLRQIPVLFAISIFLTVYNYADEWLLGFIDPNMTAIASYAIAIKGINIIISIITSMSMVFAPRAASYIKENKLKYNNLIKYAIAFTLIIALPITILMCVEIRPLLALITGVNNYPDVLIISLILASVIITYSLHEIIYVTVMLPQNKEKQYLITIGIFTLINLALSFLFVFVLFKEQQLIGLSLAVLICDIFLVLALIIQNHKEIIPTFFNKNVLKIVSASGILAIISVSVHLAFKYLLSSLFSSLNALYLTEAIIVCSLSILCYIITNFITKENIFSSLLKNKDEFND